MKDRNNYVEVPDNSYAKINLPPKLLHEQIIKKEEHEFVLEKVEKENIRLKEILNKRLGYVGKFFGEDTNSARNITAVIVLSLIVGGTIISGVIYIVDQDKDLILKIWSGIFPIITLSLGYLFGKSGNKESNTEG